MGRLWPEGSYQARCLIWKEEDIEANETWALLEPGLDRLMYDSACGITATEIMEMYTAVFQYCTSETARKRVHSYKFGEKGNFRGAFLMGGELYNRFIKWLRDYLSRLKPRLMSHSNTALVELYVEELTHYAKTTEYIMPIFRYLHRHWLKHERKDGNHNVHSFYELQLLEWRDELQEVTRKVIKAISKLKKQHEANAAVYSQVKAIVDCLDSLGRNDRNRFSPTADCEVDADQSQSQCSAIVDLEDISDMEEDMRQTLRLDPDINIEPQLSDAHHNATTALAESIDNAVVKLECQVAECYDVIKIVLGKIHTVNDSFK